MRTAYPEVDLAPMQIAISMIYAAQLLTHDLETVVHKPAGLTWPGFRLLFALWVAGTCRPGILAQRLALHPSTVTSVVNTLTRADLIERIADAEDGRSVHLRLSSAGRRTLRKLLPAQQRREADWAAALSERERQTLVRPLGKLLDNAP